MTSPVDVEVPADDVGEAEGKGPALSGLGGGGGGRKGSNSGGSSGDKGASSGLTPEAEEALKTLKLLAAVYGDGDTTDPQVKELRKELSVSGSGNTAERTAWMIGRQE
ncbi:hypothetical protein [Nocardia sp. NPDC052112]|uniref:hypothetical protein n=1 Tax=Nocardia sp. NPDC052112 TaxID=3155646 RepID=UPI0034481C83